MASLTRGSGKKRRCEASATALIDSVDFVKDMLMRLPAKRILQCKTVSKHWYSLICDPLFVVEYAKRNSNAPLGLIMNSRTDPHPEFFFVPLQGEIRPPSYQTLPCNREIKIQNMCNGLLCYAEPHKDGSGPTSYFVCNPASGQTRTARVLEPQANLKLIAVNLAFDPLKSAFYNLIFVAEESRSLGSQKMIRIDIYSSETQSRGQVPVSVPSNAGFKNGVYWDGAIYWYHQQRNSLSYFDIEVGATPERLEMPQLATGRAPTQVDYFGQSEGRLLFVGVCRQLNTPFKVFELQQGRSGWFLKYESDFSTLIGRTRVCQFSVVRVLDSEREEDFSIVLKVPVSVILYNVKKKTLRKLLDLPQGCPCNFWTWGYMRVKAYQWTEGWFGSEVLKKKHS